ncbi:hypothetical protein D9M70_453120 [compost metagenome]
MHWQVVQARRLRNAPFAVLNVNRAGKQVAGCDFAGQLHAENSGARRDVGPHSFDPLRLGRLRFGKLSLGSGKVLGCLLKPRVLVGQRAQCHDAGIGGFDDLIVVVRVDAVHMDSSRVFRWMGRTGAPGFVEPCCAPIRRVCRFDGAGPIRAPAPPLWPSQGIRRAGLIPAYSPSAAMIAVKAGSVCERCGSLKVATVDSPAGLIWFRATAPRTALVRPIAALGVMRAASASDTRMPFMYRYASGLLCASMPFVV